MDAEVSWDFLTRYQCVCVCVLSCELTMRLFHDWHGVQEGINLDDRSGGMCMYLCLRACVCLCIKQIPLLWAEPFCRDQSVCVEPARAGSSVLAPLCASAKVDNMSKEIQTAYSGHLSASDHWISLISALQPTLSFHKNTISLLLLILNLFLQQNSAVLQMQNQTVKHGAAKGWRHNARVSVCLLQVC